MYLLTTMTIANAGTTSGAQAIPERGSVLVVETPAALTGTVTLHGSIDGTTYKPMYSAGAAVTLAANAIHTISPIEVNYIKLVSSLAEAASRSFTVKVD